MTCIMLILRRLCDIFQDMDATVLQDLNAQPMLSLQYGKTALMLNLDLRVSLPVYTAEEHP